MTFVDGEPIDASKLSNLETRLNLLESSIPKSGISDGESKPLQIQTGSSTISMSSTKNSTLVQFKTNFEKAPIVVVSLIGGATSTVLSLRVNNESTSGFECIVSGPKPTKELTVKFNYIAILY